MVDQVDKQNFTEQNSFCDNVSANMKKFIFINIKLNIQSSLNQSVGIFLHTGTGSSNWGPRPCLLGEDYVQNQQKLKAL